MPLQRGAPHPEDCQRAEENTVRIVAPIFYKTLLFLACLSMVAAFGTILLGIVARLAHWDIAGLDAYAGYSIASALFLALPDTLRHGDHIRVTLVLHKLPARLRGWFEAWCLACALGLTSFMAYYACNMAWVSYVTHDVSPGSDMTPLWIPQLTMALGCIGFALAFIDASLARLGDRQFFPTESADLARAE
jgi:TRAP-type C4-dicarboxylate transport system permease small subunit